MFPVLNYGLVGHKIAADRSIVRASGVALARGYYRPPFPGLSISGFELSPEATMWRKGGTFDFESGAVRLFSFSCRIYGKGEGEVLSWLLVDSWK